MSKNEKMISAKNVAYNFCVMSGESKSESNGRTFAAYLFLLSSVDWSRDLRKKKTICSDCLKDARLAVEVFDAEMKTENNHD